MIKSFKHKGLSLFWEKGDKSKLKPAHISKIENILDTLNSATNLQSCDMPNKRLHPLKEFDPVRYSLDVSANYRITFEFVDGNAYNVDYIDTH